MDADAEAFGRFGLAPDRSYVLLQGSRAPVSFGQALLVSPFLGMP
ncbi:hypothetical protein [Streptomyces violascens]|nr:hypothetical protein [Streptomyces violascens]